MQSSQHHLYFWSITVSIGYLFNYWVTQQEYKWMVVVSMAWVLLMAFPLGDAVATGVRGTKESATSVALSRYWAYTVGLGVVLTLASLATESHAFKHFAFRTYWFLIGAIGFAYTAYKVEGVRRALYGVAAVGNLVALVYLMIDYEAPEHAAFLIGFFVQGLPVLVDLYFHQQMLEREKTDALTVA